MYRGRGEYRSEMRQKENLITNEVQQGVMIVDNNDISDKGFIVESRGPNKLGNKELRICLFMLGVVLLGYENKLNFFNITIRANMKDSVSESWGRLTGNLNTLISMVERGEIQFLLWGVECHRRRRGVVVKREEVKSRLTLIGKPHIHAVVGVGSRTGEEVLEGELRSCFLKYFNSVSVKRIKEERDMYVSLNNIMKEYRMLDVANNLLQIEEYRRFGLIAFKDLIANLEPFINRLSNFEDKELISLIQVDSKVKMRDLKGFTKNKRLILAYNCVEQLLDGGYMVFRKGRLFKLIKGVGFNIEYEIDLSSLIYRVANKKGLGEVLPSGLKTIKRYILKLL